MSELLLFAAGFFSALVFVAAVFVGAAIWWFVSYSKHLKERQEADPKLSKADQMRSKRRWPIGVETDDL